MLDELSVRALSRDIMKQNRVTVHPEKSVPGRPVTAMVSVWHRIAVRYCRGGAAGRGAGGGLADGPEQGRGADYRRDSRRSR